MNESWHYYTTENDWTGASGNHYAVYNERHMTSAWAGANAQYQFLAATGLVTKREKQFKYGQKKA